MHRCYLVSLIALPLLFANAARCRADGSADLAPPRWDAGHATIHIQDRLGRWWSGSPTPNADPGYVRLSRTTRALRVTRSLAWDQITQVRVGRRVVPRRWWAFAIEASSRAALAPEPPRTPDASVSSRPLAEQARILLADPAPAH